jgi:(p)ppGpp synthase/HD superfamily hydrolase
MKLYLYSLSNNNTYLFNTEIDNYNYNNLFWALHNRYGRIREYYVSKIYNDSKKIIILVFLDKNITDLEIINDNKVKNEYKNYLLYKKSIESASELHKEQKYGSFLPYIYHLHKVDKVISYFFNDLPTDYIFKLKICAILHDTLEDTSLTYNELKNQFGMDIADAVLAVTKKAEFNEGGDHWDYEIEYCKIIANNQLALYTKIADKCANNRFGLMSKKQKRLEKNLKQHNIFVKECYKHFEGKNIKQYLEKIMNLTKKELDKF